VSITAETTTGELEKMFAYLRCPFRVIPRRVSGGGYNFIIQVQVPGGSATFSNASFAAALDSAVAFMTLQKHERAATATADPEGARVGPAPVPEHTGTRVGYAQGIAHCAACGHGEDPGTSYSTLEPCINCGASTPCILPNGHEEGQHAVREEEATQ
jgi:hypothetical protein